MVSPQHGLTRVGLSQQSVAPGDLDFEALDLRCRFGQGLVQLAASSYGGECIHNLPQSMQLIRE
jgi:hypothetical protein